MDADYVDKAAPGMSEWDDYLASVDNTPQAAEVIDVVKTVFTTAGIRDPSSALGLLDTDLAAKVPADNLAALALLLRVLRALNQASQIQAASELASSSQLPPMLTLQNDPSQGAAGASALAAAGFVAPSTRIDVNVFELLKAAGLEKVP